jgi:hypothetical protein
LHIGLSESSDFSEILFWEGTIGVFGVVPPAISVKNRQFAPNSAGHFLAYFTTSPAPAPHKRPPWPGGWLPPVLTGIECSRGVVKICSKNLFKKNA